MTTRRMRELIHEGEYLAEVDVDLIIRDDGWSPTLSSDDARKLDEVRRALQRGDMKRALTVARVYRLTPVNAA